MEVSFIFHTLVCSPLLTLRSYQIEQVGLYMEELSIMPGLCYYSRSVSSLIIVQNTCMEVKYILVDHILKSTIALSLEIMQGVEEEYIVLVC